MGVVFVLEVFPVFTTKFLVMRGLIKLNLVLFVTIYGLGAWMQYSNGVQITWFMNIFLALVLLLPGFVIGLAVVGMTRRY